MASKHGAKKTTDWMDDGDGAHWLPSKRKSRKVTSASETKKRFNKSTLTVKQPGKKKTSIKK